MFAREQRVKHHGEMQNDRAWRTCAEHQRRQEVGRGAVLIRRTRLSPAPQAKPWAPVRTMIATTQSIL
ncbi:hypothetical protein [Pandoravirus japonicus]|uniref:Uncharacterized protein n=1 Tax=Pandoravirus japonicus TaxID=2823154 RepID=A0A811BQT7_9VIRU|nr:hypothetical protein [Pandoravirus japonicus]